MRGLTASLIKCVFAAGVALAFSACTTVPQQLRGDFADVNTKQASTEQFLGQQVRWGGVVTRVFSTDQGECAEVGWLMLDRWTLRPKFDGIYIKGGVYGHPGDNNPIYPFSVPSPMRTGTIPRFLACGDGLRDRDTYFIGAVITMTGTLESSKVYQVEYADCVRNTQAFKAVYADTVHATNGEICVVSMPVLQVKSVQKWKEQPIFDRTFNHDVSW